MKWLDSFLRLVGALPPATPPAVRRPLTVR